MKFAKYIAVEGEIREGDMFISESSMHPKECVKVVVTPHSTWFEDYLGNQDVSQFCKKLILKLCTADEIEIGDTFTTIENPLGIEPKVRVMDRLFQKVIEENPMLPYYIYKEIGVISKEATWVTEDYCFNDDIEDEIQGGLWLCLDCNAVVNSQEHSAWSGCIAGYEPYFKIKGPCGHFH